MKGEKNYDIFISYRRNGGEGIARALYDRLVRRGYSVAYDRESLEAGRYDGQLLRMISTCKDVVVVLNPGAFEDSLKPKNTFRQEIAHALLSERNVIPLMMDKFEFPKAGETPLPLDIRDLAMKNGVRASMEYFDSATVKLCRFLKSKPKGRLSRWFALLFAMMIMVAGVFGVYVRNAWSETSFPVSQQDKQKFSVFVNDFVRRGGIYHDLMLEEKNLLRDSESGDTGEYGTSMAAFLNKVNSLKEQFDRCLSIGELTSLVETMPIDSGELAMFVAMLRDDFEHRRDWAECIKPGSLMNKRDRAQLIEAEKMFLEAKCGLFSAKVMMLLGNVSPSALNGIKEDAQLWSMFPQLSRPWIRDENELERQWNFCGQKLGTAVKSLSSILGNKRQALTREYDTMRQWFIVGGYSPESAQKMVDLIREVDSGKLKLKQAKEELQNLKLKNGKPSVSDSSLILRAKILRFIRDGKYKEALDGIQILKERMSRKDGKSPDDCPMEVLSTLERIAQLGDKAPFAGGMLVIGYEPPAESHAILKVGDVVTAINGEQCVTFDEFAAKSAPGKMYTVYRPNGQNSFQELKLSMPDNQPRVGLIGYGKHSK